MQFYISIKSGWRTYRLLVVQLMIDARNEQYRVIGSNKSIVLESNRPLFRGKGLKHRNPNWKVVDGAVFSGTGLDQIVEQIMQKLEPKSDHKKG